MTQGTSPSRNNGAAAMVAASLGIALIAVSAPFTVAWFPTEEATGGTTFQVAWDEAESGEPGRATLSNLGQSEATAAITDAIPASLHADFSCTDQDLSGQAPARITLTVLADGAEVASRQGTCAELSGQIWHIPLAEPPAIEDVPATDAEAAQDAIDAAAAASRTSQNYTFRAVAARDAPGGVALPGSSFSAELQLQAMAWVPTAVESTPEVVR